MDDVSIPLDTKDQFKLTMNGYFWHITDIHYDVNYTLNGDSRRKQPNSVGLILKVRIEFRRKFVFKDESHREKVKSIQK
ncbi:hypothetical protein J437_LFUL015080 [Ladona fulva]|uniref:Uncharacterized protein n=1 Tax=Ladona fulva TaxID=123851 RepID=A0A8K0KNN2_LADFU|nr:hypothetical protein J437_LFUL015080 [Ladona fulva]